MIASSPTDIQPVMDVVAESATRFCGARDAAIFRLEGESLRLVAAHGYLPAVFQIGGTMPRALGESWRAVRDRKSIHVEECWPAETEFPETLARSRQSTSSRVSRLGRCWPRRSCAKAVPWRHLHAAGRGTALFGHADRAGKDLRRPSRDRHRERAPIQRDERGARAADRDGRDPASDRELADRPPARHGRRG